MTNVEKLVARLRRRPTEMRADEIATILEARGWTLATRSGTSHRKWTKPDLKSIGYTVEHGMVKRTYLRDIVTTLGLNEDDGR
jgi:predicted RNA binding protein YcfA (HicA-like mRNA interferase family)